MGTEQIVDTEKALQEKKTMQKEFIREHNYSSSVLTLVIEYFEERKKKGLGADYTDLRRRGEKKDESVNSM